MPGTQVPVGQPFEVGPEFVQARARFADLARIHEREGEVEGCEFGGIPLLDSLSQEGNGVLGAARAQRLQPLAEARARNKPVHGQDATATTRNPSTGWP
ncbi:MAG: hypothetical protein MUC64_13935, partial [Rubritepida sp.]|nr:hypothetical protein [Rubritepida sp.]